MIAPQRYFDAAQALLGHLQKTQLGAIGAAADAVVHALQHGGTIYCSELGHGLQGDFIHRAGGLHAVQAFTYSSSVQAPGPACRKQPGAEENDRDLAKVRFAVQQSGLRAGDVMVLGSVSGRNRAPIELALACRDLGMKTIGLTALAYTRKIVSLHPSGKRLAEAVDIAIDIGAPFGDAGVQVPGYDHELIPLSGLGTVTTGWLLWGMVMEKMAAAGTPASVYQSHNRPGGPEYNEAAKQRYNQQGY